MSAMDGAAPDYRGSQNSPPNTQLSYSFVTKSVPKLTFPKKDQAIVIHAEDDLKLSDYVKAVGNAIDPKNIIFASRISNNRICIYLSKKEIVDDLLRTSSSITIGDRNLSIRRLISPSKRIIISNISPCIPHAAVELALKDLGLTLTSPISFLKASIPGDAYSHILSFRRQVYILPSTDDFQLQTSLIIQHEGTDHRIFLSTDRMECFICKEAGHIAAHCTSSPTTTTLGNASTHSTVNSMAAEEITNKPTSQPLNNPSQKRCLSDTLTSDQTGSVCEIQDDLPTDGAQMPPPFTTSKPDKRPKQAKKKRKTMPTSAPLLSEGTKQIISDRYQASPNDFIIPIDNFFAFLENSFGSNKPYEIALGFTQDIKSLLENMYAIYPFLVERSIKNRFTRIHKKIKSQYINSDAFELNSISSVQSQSSLDENTYLDEPEQSDETLSN